MLAVLSSVAGRIRLCRNPAEGVVVRCRDILQEKGTFFSIWLPSCQGAGRSAFSGPAWLKRPTRRVLMWLQTGYRRQGLQGWGRETDSNGRLLQMAGGSPTSCLPLANYRVLVQMVLHSVPPQETGRYGNGADSQASF